MAEFIVVHSVKVATDFTPETFGRLTTIGPGFLLPVGRQGEYKPRQVCECSCGEITVVRTNDLRTGRTWSCSCLNKERASEANITHGMRHSPEYTCYCNMMQRCTNSNRTDYPRYGGRGIRVCDRWLDPENGFVNFLSDMGPKPAKKLSIERELVDGDYCPENCRWATNTEQARNKRNNVNITFRGKTQCIAAWAEETGLSCSRIGDRLRNGWSVEDALITPLHAHTKNKKQCT